MRRNLGVLVVFAAVSAKASTYVVNDLGDAGDAVPGNGACATAGAVCTFRAAIEEANAHAGADTIQFAVAGTIVPSPDYPPIVQQTTIDGRTAPGYAPGTPVVLIKGPNWTGSGLIFGPGSSGSFLYGLYLFRFNTVVTVDSDEVTIRNNQLSGNDGLVLGGTGSRVGGVDGEGNVITGNFNTGMLVTGSNHVISDNVINNNLDEGVRITSATGVFIGATGPHAENVITGNNIGIEIDAGSGNTIAGNFLGTDATGTLSTGGNSVGIWVKSPGNIIGTPTGRNVVADCNQYAIYVTNATDTVVQNNYVGVDVTGTRVLYNDGWTTIGGGTNVVIGGTGPSEGNIFMGSEFEGLSVGNIQSGRISGNIFGRNDYTGLELHHTSDMLVDSNIEGFSGGSERSIGHGIHDFYGTRNVYEANRIGTNAGMTSFGNEGSGLVLEGTVDVIVRSNQIVGNGLHGISVTGGSSGTIIHSNIIGLSADLSTPIANQLDGIHISDDSHDTVIGSAVQGGNTIAGNEGNGIGIEADALAHNTWAANAIYDNALLGIDIGGDGVTPNDPDDPDQGPNGLQNFPLLASALNMAAGVEIAGALDTLPNTPFTIDFYSSPAADPSGFGEGQTYLGASSGTTNANGDATFVFVGPVVTPGHVITATATTSDGTSEFSAAVAMTTGAADLSIAKTTTLTTFVPGQQVTYTIAVTNSGPDAAEAISVTDVLPVGMTLVSASGDDATCTGTTTITCTIPFLANGATSTIALVVIVNANAPISNTASVVAVVPPDPTPANDASTTIISPAASAGATIPTTSEWGLLLLALALSFVAMRAVR
jgi:uncharacterized repeat protein (TIGR01451 family)